MRLLRLGNRIGIFIFISHFILIALVIAQKPISAVGRIVNKNNQPVANAIVCFRGRGSGDVVPCGVSGNDGQFQVSDSIWGNYGWLIIEERVPGMVRVAIDSYDLKQIPRFRGLKLKVPDDPKFTHQLEFIKPHLTYTAVELDLTKLFAGVSVKDAYELTYRVEYEKKRIVNNVYVDARDFDYKTKKLKWTMPVGNWKVTIKLKGGGVRRDENFFLILRK